MATQNYLEKSLLNHSITASGAVAKERFVTAARAQCGLGAKALGVSQYAAADTEDLAIATHGLLRIDAGGTIAAGGKVTSDADGKAIAYLEPFRKTIKAADQAKISDTTLANDTVLKDIDARISKTYTLRAHLVFKNEHSSAQSVKFAFTAPASATLVGSIKEANAIDDSLTLKDDDADLTSTQIVQIDAPDSGESDERGVVEIDAKLVMSTTAGNIDLQWAQNASIAANLSLMAESYIEIIDDSPEALNGYAVTAGAASAKMQIIMQ